MMPDRISCEHASLVSSILFECTFARWFHKVPHLLQTEALVCTMQLCSRPRSCTAATAVRNRPSQKQRCALVFTRAAAVSQNVNTVSANYMSAEEKHALVRRLIAAKDDSGLSLDEIGERLGVTNVFAGQILHNQARSIELHAKAHARNSLCRHAATGNTAQCDLACMPARTLRVWSAWTMRCKLAPRTRAVSEPAALQTQLKPDLEEKLRKAVPGISEEDIAAMRKCPSRSYDPNILQDPHIFRMNEAVLHFGQSIKTLVNEKV